MNREEQPPKTAILLVAFGTSVPEAQAAFDRIESGTAEAFPGKEIRWAYTSGFIRAKLAREGRVLDSPETALARLKDEGFSHVAVLSLHVFPGQEFHDLHRTAMFFTQMPKGFRRLVVARPLLASYEDLVRTARALLLQIPSRRRPDEAVLFMGHGNQKHPADMVYAAMNFVLHGLSENVHVATVQGRPSVEDLLPDLINMKTKRVWLLPFMTVAGEHARKDMDGDGPDSWRSVLARNGIDCEVQMAGIAENPAIVEIWLDHLRDVLRLFDDERAEAAGPGRVRAR
jgi:sirohydrochlorin cobaltochelatase